MDIMRTIRIHFTDFWPDFREEENFVVAALKEKYTLVFDPVRPQYLFYSSFGSRSYDYPEAIKVYFTGENDVPDFTISDYAMSSAILDFGDRHLRLPLYVLYAGFENLYRKVPVTDQLSQRKFCNFVYSNVQKSDPIREAFFQRLSQYKKVDSGGRYLNNIGGPVADKQAFISDYKFTIAFENSSQPGYTTEKLTDPMHVMSLPVYWGNPNVDLDFNPQSFLWLRDSGDMEQLIEEIIYLDTHPDAYLNRLSQPWTTAADPAEWRRRISSFLYHIIDQDITQARRTSSYGFANDYYKANKFGRRITSNKLIRRLLKHF